MNLVKVLCYVTARGPARALSTSAQLSKVASVSQANIDKGHAEWDGSIRPLYMDAQVRCNFFKQNFCGGVTTNQWRIYSPLVAARNSNFLHTVCL